MENVDISSKTAFCRVSSGNLYNCTQYLINQLAEFREKEFAEENSNSQNID